MVEESSIRGCNSQEVPIKLGLMQKGNGEGPETDRTGCVVYPQGKVVEQLEGRTFSLKLIAVLEAIQR